MTQEGSRMAFNGGKNSSGGDEVLVEDLSYEEANPTVGTTSTVVSTVTPTAPSAPSTDSRIVPPLMNTTTSTLAALASSSSPSTTTTTVGGSGFVPVWTFPEGYTPQYVYPNPVYEGLALPGHRQPLVSGQPAFLPAPSQPSTPAVRPTNIGGTPTSATHNPIPNNANPSSATQVLFPNNNQQQGGAPNLTPPLTLEMLQQLIANGVQQQLQQANMTSRGIPSFSQHVGPLAPAIYAAVDADLKVPNLETFRGSSDTRDPESFIFSFREKMRLANASDPAMCRVFTTCLTDEAWEWYWRLPAGCITCFEDFMRLFYKRYAGLRRPRVLCTSLFSYVQDPQETLSAFVRRFSDTARRVEDFNDDIAIAAIRHGLKKGGPGTPRHDAHQREFRTMQEFMIFLESYIRAEEDCGATIYNPPSSKSTHRQRSPSPRRNSSPRRHDKKQKSVLKDSRNENRQFQSNSSGEQDRKQGKGEYRSHYTYYAEFDRPQEELFNIIKESHALPPPLKMDLFDIQDKREYCAFHQANGHSTRSCIRLRDVLEKLARQGELTPYITKDFFRKHKKLYNGKGRQFKTPIRRKGDSSGEDQDDDSGRRSRQRTPIRHSTPEINVIAGGIPKAQPTKNQKRANKKQRLSIMNIETKNLGNNGVISFSEEDAIGLQQPHDDAIVLSLKVGMHRVKRILVDTGSSADILYLSALLQMGFTEDNLTKVNAPLTGFSGGSVNPIGMILLPVSFGIHPKSTVIPVQFLVVDLDSAYNVIIGRRTLNHLGAIVSSYHLKIKFPTEAGIGEERGEQNVARKCYELSTSSTKGNVYNISKHKVKSNCMKVAQTLPQSTKPNVEAAEQIQEVDLGGNRMVKIGVAMREQSEKLQQLLRDNADCFAFSAEEMPGIPRQLAEHKLHVDPSVKPVKQKRRPLGAERNKAVKIEVAKLLQARFIREVECPSWLANPVLVKKSNGDWRMCIDFTNLNKACPMDPFPMPKIDQLIDSTAGFGFLTFMDAFSGYNQIRMHPEDEEKTAFTTDVGLYCYRVMPFGLKNAGATFQKMVNKVFASQIGRNMEVYMDDMLVKSSSEEQHLSDLQEAFQTMRTAQLKLNPKKSFFGLQSGKFLGFLISARGIEIHPAQSQAIIQMTPPTNLKDLQVLTGKLVALNRFIAKSGEVCLPFFRLMKKNTPFVWDDTCQTAFARIKEYLADPPLLSKPQVGEELLLYIAASDKVVSAALVKEVNREQKPVYFVSHVLRDAETRYPPLEKMALALITAARKLRPYFQTHSIRVLTNSPVKKALTNLNSSGRMLSWAIELSEFDIIFQPRTALKSQILADFLAEYTGPEAEEEIKLWQLFVDGASSSQGAGVGVLMLGPKGEQLSYAATLKFAVTNNAAEYEAMILGLRLAQEVGAEEVNLYSDSQLAVMQINDNIRVLDQKLTIYRETFQKMRTFFRRTEVQHVPRAQNVQADALSKLGAAGNLKKENSVRVLEISYPSIQKSTDAVLSIAVEEMDDWYKEMWKFLIDKELPTDETQARRIKRLAPRYQIIEGDLFKRGYSYPWLKCLNSRKAQEMIAEVHEGVCGSHQGAKTLSKRILRAGFWWPSIEEDTMKYVRKCDKCQRASKITSVPPYERISIASAWPFDLWGIDILGPFPQATKQRRFIIVAVEYFTRWVEAEALAKITAIAVEKFIWKNIICRFGLPHALITDNGTQFTSSRVTNFCAGFRIRNNFASVSHPQTNGLAEVTNRTILEGLSRKIEEHKTEWADLLDDILWAYRTTPREATQETPFSLVFGMEAVTPMELVDASARITGYQREANMDLRMNELDLVEEKRRKAQARSSEYHRRIKRVVDKKVSPRTFFQGDLVLRSIEATGKPIKKLDPKWEGPFRVSQVCGKGAYKLETMMGEPIPRTWNALHLRKFYT